MKQNFIEKYIPKTIDELPIEPEFVRMMKTLIRINNMKIMLISDDDYMKNIVIKTIIKEFNALNNEILYVSHIKDQGVSNMRYELKLFCQTPSSRFRKKKILILDDIQVFSDNMQKLIVNNIDKWSDNINIIITSKSIYSVDQSLSSRVVPINIPNIHKEILKKNILSVCEKESVNISPVGIDYILKINENNILALLNNLHKCKLLQTYDSIIDLDTLRKCCTLINDTDFNMYIDLCKNKKIMESYELLLTFINNGYSVMDILNEFYHYVKISENIDEEHKYKLFKIISGFIINFITIHEEELELLIFSYDISNVLYI